MPSSVSASPAITKALVSRPQRAMQQRRNRVPRRSHGRRSRWRYRRARNAIPRVRWDRPSGGSAPTARDTRPRRAASPLQREAFAAQGLVNERDHRMKQRRAMSGGPDHPAAAGMLGMPARRNRARRSSSSVSTCSALEEEPPGWPDWAASTAAKHRPRTTRQRLAMRGSSISGIAVEGRPRRLR